MENDFVSIERFEDHVENFDKLGTKIEVINKELGTKVSWVIFWSILLLLVGIVGTIFGILYASIKEVQRTGTETQNTVSYIRGVLDNSEIIR